MIYSQFVSIPAELMIQIIKKCYPLPYTRLRQTCHFLDDICENNRTRLGIYNYRRDPHLFITNSLQDSHLFPYYKLWPEPSRKTDIIELNEKIFYLILDYDIYHNNMKFIIPLKPKNINRIRKALSGFAFTHLFVESYCLPYSEKTDNRLIEAVKLFFQIGANFKIKNLFVSEVPLASFKRLTCTWQLDHIFLYSFAKDMRPYLQLDSVKMVPSISYETWFGASGYGNENDILEASASKKHLRIHDPCNLHRETAWIALNRIYEGWTKVTDVPDTVALGFQTNCLYYEKIDMWKEFQDGKLHLPKDIAYFLTFYDDLDREHKYDIWLIEIPGYWRVVSLRRRRFDICARLLVRTVQSREELAMIFIELATVGGTKKIGVDFSIFYEHLVEAATVKKIRYQFKKLVDFVKVKEFDKVYM